MYLHVWRESAEAVTSVSVDHLWRVKTQLLIRVDRYKDGGDPGVDLVALEAVVEVLYQALLRAGVVVGQVGAADLRIGHYHSVLPRMYPDKNM
jgi:hypothetical protein